MEETFLQSMRPMMVQKLLPTVHIFKSWYKPASERDLRPCFLPFVQLPAAERVSIVDETEGRVDQAAVLTSNILFFIVMFIFAVFETYALRCCHSKSHCVTFLYQLVDFHFLLLPVS